MTYFIINDNSAGQLAADLQPDRSGGAVIGVLADQTVPANSPEVSLEQKKLREWAERNQIPFAYGRAMTGALTAGDDSAGFGWRIEAGDVVVATVLEVYGAGGCGAAGLCLGAEEFACALKRGSLPERRYLDNPEAQFKKITVCGALKDGVMVSDAAETACRSLMNLEHKELTVLLADGAAMDGFSRAERAVFCQRLARLGFMTVTAITDAIRSASAGAETVCRLDLETVTPVMASVDLATAPVSPAAASVSPAAAPVSPAAAPVSPAAAPVSPAAASVPPAAAPVSPAAASVPPAAASVSSVTASVDPRTIACVYIGGMGGFLSDIRLAAEMLAGNHTAKGVRLLVSPASADIYCEAADAGYLAVIMDAGGMVLNQCAGPAVQGRIGENEVMVSNDCHEETGYAGPKSSRVILASTRTAVSCALSGRMGKENR